MGGQRGMKSPRISMPADFMAGLPSLSFAYVNVVAPPLVADASDESDFTRLGPLGQFLP